MAHTLILHVMNSDPIVGEPDELPGSNDRLILIKNPRRLDGKDLNFLAENVTTLFIPIERLNFIELMGLAEEEEIIGFVRE